MSIRDRNVATIRRIATSWLFAAIGFLLTCTVKGDQTNALVQTLDGHTYAGVTALQSNRVLVTVKGSAGNSISITNLESLTFTGNIIAAPVETNGTGSGLLGYYYHNTNLLGAPLTRLDKTVNFTWKAHHHPHPDFSKDHWSARWMGFVTPPRTDDYMIHFGSDDGGRLWVADQGPYASWKRQEYAEVKAPIRMVKGNRYKIRVEYFESIGNARAQLWWSSPRMPKRIIPQEHLHPASFLLNHSASIAGDNGLLATYFDHPQFRGNSFTRLDPLIDATWSTPLSPDIINRHEEWHPAWNEFRRATNALHRFLTRHQLYETDEGERVFDRRWKSVQGRVARSRKQLEKAQTRLTAVSARKPPDPNAVRAGALAMQEARAALVKDSEEAATFETITGLETELKQTATLARQAMHRSAANLRDASITLDNDIADGIPGNFFSVRWSGQIIAEANGPHTLHFQSDEPARVWFNDQPRINGLERPGETRFTETLEAGQYYPIRIETGNTDGFGEARLLWSHGKAGSVPVPSTSLVPYLPSSTTDAIDRSPVKFAPGVALDNGVYVQAPLSRIDRTAVYFDGVLSEQSIPRLRVSRIHIRTLTPAQLAQLLPGRVGVLLVNRDFVEGKLLRMEEGQVWLSSVLFGPVSFNTASEVSVIVLKEGPGLPGPYEVTTTDGTTIHSPNIETVPAGVIYRDSGLTVPVGQLRKIRKDRSERIAPFAPTQ